MITHLTKFEEQIKNGLVGHGYNVVCTVNHSNSFVEIQIGTKTSEDIVTLIREQIANFAELLGNPQQWCICVIFDKDLMQILWRIESMNEIIEGFRTGVSFFGDSL